MKLILFDRDWTLVAAWKKHFGDCPDVEVLEADILKTNFQARALVSPANSFGFMDGGIDAIYTELMTGKVQLRVQMAIAADWDGELPVGSALSVTTDFFRFPNLIAAPTMAVPMPVAHTDNAYSAFRAALRVAKAKKFESIACPGMGTATGGISAENCAVQMRRAYGLTNNEISFPDSIKEAYFRHRDMLLGIPHDRGD